MNTGPGRGTRPRRDLWMVVSETGEESRRYADVAGREVDPARLAL